MNLTQPLGTVEAPTPMHIDDWLESAVMSSDKGTRYASFFLHHKRLSAVAKNAFAEFLGPMQLFCTYKEKRMRCTGASRMGDVWLTSNHQQETGYELRVDVNDCSAWSDKII